MLVEFIKVLTKIEADMWRLEEKAMTTDPEYYRLTGARNIAMSLKDFYEKQMVATGRIRPEQKGESDEEIYQAKPD